MKKYIGTKQVEAMPMSLGEFINRSGRNPYANDGKMHGDNEEGYLVQYEDGYESWSPKEVFDKAYKVADTALDRMLIERKELKEKSERLHAFVGSSKFGQTVKDENQRKLLIRQSYHMTEYLNILNQRIKLMQG